MTITKKDLEILKIIDKLEPKAKCLRANIACALVKNGKVLVKATNDWDKGMDCRVHGCIRDKMKVKSGTRREICYGLCAEQWCLALAAKKGISINGATAYITKHPCRICESLLCEAGIKRVVFQEGYPDVLPHFDLFEKRKVKVEQAPATNLKDPKRLKADSI
ncbi:hypothetical protein KJ632_01790 [Patescibacteria group bacterium]|nr:hypothetical protein [Patescibacteria group bacterium]